MAAAPLLRSLASKMAGARATHLARRLHGGVRSGRGGSLTHHRLLHQRGLHSRNSPNSGASGSTPPISTTELHTALAKIRSGVAYAAVFGAMVYMYSIFPQLEANLEARKRSKLNEALIIETLEILQGHGKQRVGDTGRQKRLDDLEAEITKLDIALEAGRSK